MARKKKNDVSVRTKMFCEELNAHATGLFTDAFRKRVDGVTLNNLKYQPREYQIEALGRFDMIRKEKVGEGPKKTNLLYHMATGSGKTLVIAANILQLFQEGYCDFIFFVNSKNVIKKTKENFLNPTSSKYLFAERVEVGGRTIEIAEISTLADSVPGRINILFTTIQGLHSDLNTPRENSMTYRDFDGRKIVLLSDETHHLNAITKLKDTRQNIEAIKRDDFTGLDLASLKGEDKESLRSWEGTVMKLFHATPENVLLEYTATIDLEDVNIFNKYKDKILYQYDLRQYRNDGFSKDIEVLESDLAPMDRALQAIVLSQYRRLLAAKNRISLKPVILFKANFVNVPKRLPKGVADVIVLSEFKALFHSKITALRGVEINAIQERVTAQEGVNRRLRQAFEFFAREGITHDALASMIREEFDESRCLSVNDEGENDQILLNTLEDASNRVRAVFAVEKLNEGWDVLNLFDIVRLYDTRDARDGKPGEKTIREAQLIGRGARYCPFAWEDLALDKRKFDNDEENELRVLEELFFHSKNNAKYIQELRQAMIFTGIMPKETRSLPVRVKDTFKKTDLWKSGVVLLNKKVKIDVSLINGLADGITEKQYKVKLFTGSVNQSSFLGTNTGAKDVATERETKVVAFEGVPKEVVRKALDQIEFFHLENLRRYFPNLKSIDEFITGGTYLSCLSAEVFGDIVTINALSRDELLYIVRRVLTEVREEIQRGWHEHEGTKEFFPRQINEIARDRILNIAVEDGSDQEFGIAISETKNNNLNIPIGKRDWYIYSENYGTSVEKEFLNFLESKMSAIEERFTEFFVLRNEKSQIFRFTDGKATEPDFVLFMKEKTASEYSSYQVFVEAKGSHLIEQDQWKEDFLLMIEGGARLPTSYEISHLKLIGLPFFTNDLTRKKKFHEDFNRFIK